MLRGIESTTIGGYGVTIRSGGTWFRGIDSFDDFVSAARRAGVELLILDDHHLRRSGELRLGRNFPRAGDDPFATGQEVLFEAKVTTEMADKIIRALMARGFMINYGALS